jgi:hypothetical protein
VPAALRVVAALADFVWRIELTASSRIVERRILDVIPTRCVISVVEPCWIAML